MGIAAAKLGAHVLFTDFAEDTLELCHANVERNLSETEAGACEVAFLDWDSPINEIKERLPRKRMRQVVTPE